MGKVCSKCGRHNQSSRKICQFCNWDLSTTYEVAPVKKGFFNRKELKATANDVAEVALKARGEIEKQNKENRKSTESADVKEKSLVMRIRKINIGPVSMEDIEIGMKKTSKKGKKVEYKD